MKLDSVSRESEKNDIRLSFKMHTLSNHRTEVFVDFGEGFDNMKCLKRSKLNEVITRK